MLHCWRRTGHLPSFFFPTPGDLPAQESPPPGICHPRQKNANSWGQPGGGGLGAGGIDWCIIFWHNSSRVLDLRGLFLYSGRQVSHSHVCFSSSLRKSFTLGLWHFFTNKFTILGLSFLNLHNLGHIYFPPKSDMPEVKRALPHHLSRVFGAGKLTNHKCCEVQQVVMQMIKLKVCCKK